MFGVSISFVSLLHISSKENVSVPVYFVAAECKGDPQDLGSSLNSYENLEENQVAMLGFKKISLTESEWINSLGFKPAGIVRYKGLKGFLMWLSSVQKIGLLVWALLLSHWSLFCIVLSTTETGGWSLLSWIIWQDLALLLLSKIFFCEGGIDFC